MVRCLRGRAYNKRMKGQNVTQKIHLLENHVAVLVNHLGPGVQFFVCDTCLLGGVRNYEESCEDTILQCEGGCDRYFCNDCIYRYTPQFDRKTDFLCNLCDPSIGSEAQEDSGVQPVTCAESRDVAVTFESVGVPGLSSVLTSSSTDMKGRYVPCSNIQFRGTGPDTGSRERIVQVPGNIRILLQHSPRVTISTVQPQVRPVRKATQPIRRPGKTCCKNRSRPTQNKRSVRHLRKVGRPLQRQQYTRRMRTPATRKRLRVRRQR